jgi:GntR family transcriptional regulator, rspAB operon transcriptional repressor
MVMNQHDGVWEMQGDHLGGSVQRAPIRRISASQQIHSALRDRIVSLELAPGQSLSRAEIADYYGVSQTPVRDAMLKLEEEGLLLVFPQSKTEVSKIDVEHARETQFLRLSVELEVTRRLTASDDKTLIARAEHVFSLQETAFASHDLIRFTYFDQQFHQSLCESVGVANLWKLVTSRSGHIDRLRNLNLPDPGKLPNIMHYHKAILTAIRNGDLAAAEDAVRAHLSGTLSQVDAIMVRYPDYF